MKKLTLILGALALLRSFNSIAQTSPSAATPAATPKKWYDSFSIRGYGQVRYNRLFETNDQLKSEQGDRSIGDNGGFFIRRLRIIFSGQINERVYFLFIF